MAFISFLSRRTSFRRRSCSAASLDEDRGRRAESCHSCFYLVMVVEGVSWSYEFIDGLCTDRVDSINEKLD